MPTFPLADPLPLPAPPWLLAALLVATFVAHALPMNLLLGGSLIAGVAHLRGRRNPHAAALARAIARAMPAVVAATVTFGVATLLFLQALYGRVFFATAVLLAVPWLAIVPLVLAAYASTYWNAVRAESRTSAVWASWLVAVLVAAVAFLQSNVMSLMARPQVLGVWFRADASGVRLNLSDPTLVPRYLHVLVGATAVAGVAVAVGGYLLRDRDRALSAWMLRHGVVWCAVATSVNLLPGFWWLATLPPPTLSRFMGHDLVATICLGGGVLAAVAGVGHLIPASFATNPRPLLIGGAGSLGTSLVLMIGVREIARRAALESAGFAPITWVDPQWAAMALFGAIVAGAGLTIVWMIRALVRAPGVAA